MTTTDVDDLIRTMQKKGLTAKSIRNYVGTLSAMLKWAAEPKRRWVTENVCVGCNMPARKSKDRAIGEITFLSAAEVWTLADYAMPGPYKAIDRAMYLTAAMAGLRYGELCGLRWQDIDWGASAIRVRRSWDYVNQTLKAPKNGKARTVPLAPDLAAELNDLSKASSRAGDTDLVFGDPRDGLPLRRTPTIRRFNKALNGALVAGIVFHDLRHTFGTQLAAAGEPVRDIQEWMGHADIQTTMIYSHFAPRGDQAARIGAAFGRGPVRGPILTDSTPVSGT